jgi:hypothetical protein
MVAPRALPNWVGLGISPFNIRLIRLNRFFRIFLHPRDVTFKLLKKSTLYFGYNPRRCFDAACSMTRFEMQKDEVEIHSLDIGRTPSHILQTLQDFRKGANAVSHMIFQLRPTSKSRNLVQCDCEPVSKWAFNTLMDACEKHEADAATQLYRSLSSHEE